jgi:cathepsin L
MKSATTALALYLAVPAGASMLGERDLSKYTYEQYLEEFQNSGVYEAAPNRAEVFAKNLAHIRQHNADVTKTWFATVNEFTDWTTEEFRKLRVHGRRPDIGEADQDQLRPLGAIELPSDVDWRNKAGVVTPVKNQGGCGSCWSFSAVETLESHLAIATSEAAPVLSEQQIVSCMPNPQQCGGTGGCAGATQPQAFNYTKTHGLSLETDYPYQGVTGSCATNKIKPVATNDGFVKLKVNDYNALVSALVTKGPVAISLAAGSIGWQLYGGGIFGGGLLGKCGYDQDHGVQLVGYGIDGSKMYWLIRNSWGPHWGEKGYMRIKRYGDGKEPCGIDKTPGDGEACKGDTKPRQYCGVCGIMGSSSYPTGVKKTLPVVVV